MTQLTIDSQTLEEIYEWLAEINEYKDNPTIERLLNLVIEAYGDNEMLPPGWADDA